MWPPAGSAGTGRQPALLCQRRLGPADPALEWSPSAVEAQLRYAPESRRVTPPRRWGRSGLGETRLLRLLSSWIRPCVERRTTLLPDALWAVYVPSGYTD